MCKHLVLFYEGLYPAERVSDFLAAGLQAGDCCLALLTAAHRHAVEQRLWARGIRTGRAAYRAVDTDEALSQMRVAGRMDLRRARDLLTPLMRPPPQGGTCRVRAVGDLAPTLCAAGHAGDAVAFEGLVHHLAEEHGASVLCAYPIRPCGEQQDGLGLLMQLSAEHATVEFPDGQWAHHLMPLPASQDAAGRAGP